MDKAQLATKLFIIVRDMLFEYDDKSAYRHSYRKPLKFYLENATEQAIQILLSECV